MKDAHQSHWLHMRREKAKKPLKINVCNWRDHHNIIGSVWKLRNGHGGWMWSLEKSYVLQWKKLERRKRRVEKGRTFFFTLVFFFSPAIKSNRPSTPSIIMISSPPMQRAIDLHPRFIIIALWYFHFFGCPKETTRYGYWQGVYRLYARFFPTRFAPRILCPSPIWIGACPPVSLLGAVDLVN